EYISGTPLLRKKRDDCSRTIEAITCGSNDGGRSATSLSCAAVGPTATTTTGGLSLERGHALSSARRLSANDSPSEIPRDAAHLIARPSTNIALMRRRPMPSPRRGRSVVTESTSAVVPRPPDRQLVRAGARVRTSPVAPRPQRAP